MEPIWSAYGVYMEFIWSPYGGEELVELVCLICVVLVRVVCSIGAETSSA
jgi:hypothetical protein